MSTPISIYASHDSSLCIKTGPNDYRIYELERLTGIRNFALNKSENFREILEQTRAIILKEYGELKFGSCFYAQLDEEQVEIFAEVFGTDHHEQMSHHFAHAACAFYQSPFSEALIISSDGGGHEMNDGITSFAIFEGEKKLGANHAVKKISNLPFDFCHPYTMLAVPISEIRKQDVYTDYLKYAGKLMGLAAYGKVRNEWLVPMSEYFVRNADLNALRIFGSKIGLNLSEINTLAGQDSYDLAATAQYLFEEKTLQIIRPYIQRYGLPICLTGGGALNVLCNERIRKEFNLPVFVPCNPNDCGLSFGFMAMRFPPENGQAHVQYSGFGILDIETLPELTKRHKAKKCSVKELARMLCAGKIIGVMRGNSEAGPRALGNRSLLAWAAIDGLRDRLNRIKERESFRPVAPACRLEDAQKYFGFDGESPYMSFAPQKEADKPHSIGSAFHADGTARLQTVKPEQNKFLYDLLDAVDTICGVGVLINTSLNIKGKPIATTVAEALEIMRTTEIDAVFIEGWLFEKQ
jgi:carbamoyltransferase